MSKKTDHEALFKAHAPYLIGCRLVAAGQHERGIPLLRQAITHNPSFSQGYVDLSAALHATSHWTEAIDICEQGIAVDEMFTRLHKQLIQSLIAKQGIKGALDYFQLQRRDPRPLQIEPDEILCCLVARNEAARLPFWFSYYRQLGVNRFFVIDNGSTDRSVPFLLQQPDVHVWVTNYSYRKAAYGVAWFELLMQIYGQNHWVLLLDADELFVYAGSEHRSLSLFCQNLTKLGKTAVTGLLIDAYSDKPLANTIYQEGDDFRDVCPFFDYPTYHRRKQLGQYEVYMGGVRERVFPNHGYNYVLSQAPLMYYKKETLIPVGPHQAHVPQAEIAHDACSLMHFKFFSSFLAYIDQEVEREEHAAGASQYKGYLHQVKQDQKINLYDSTVSLRYENTNQLERLGILVSEPGRDLGND